MRTIDLNRQLLGIEDLLIGFGVVTQTRGGQTVSITKINAGSLPFDETQSLLQWAQTVNLAELGAMVDELQALYDSIDALNNLEDNLVALNTLAQAINCLNNLCDNLTKLQNIDINMAKLQNIDTNMAKLQNIDTNMTKLQNIDTNMTKLSSIYSNMSMLQTVYDNMSSINTVNTNISSINTVNTNISSVNNVSSNIAALVNINSNIANLNTINTQIIPNLSEILQVDDYAAQVAADKATVANDKASVTSMKLAVETIYDTFDDRFLGTKTSDPILDNDGNPLVDGAIYFNTSVNALKVYDLGNALWVTIPQIYLSSLLDVTLTSITTGDILTWDGSKWVNTRTPSFTSIKLTGGTGTAGTMIWNNTDFTYDIILNSDVTLQDGQEVLVPCVNSSASLISNGRPVMAVGTNGNSGNILVNLHDGTKANAKRIIGLATQDMSANNGFGFVTMIGKVRGINTTGSQYGETWVNGDILYVKATGNLTNIEPADTELKMSIAFVLHAHTNGTLYVRTTGIDENRNKLISGTSIKTINNTSVLGSGNIDTTQTTITGNAGTATKLQTARTITLTGDVDGNTSFDGSANVSINVSLDIDGATDIGTNLADTDLIMVDNGANGTNRKSAISRIWTYIGGKLTGAISTVTTSNLTTNRALASDGSGKIGVSTATSTELGYLSGVTSGVQTQINNKVAKATMTDNSVVRANGTAGEVQGSGVIINDSDNVGIGTPPSAWPTSSNVNALHLNRDGVIYSGSAFNNNYIGIGSGYYYDSSFTPTRKNNVASSEYVQYAGSHYWKTAPSGTAGSAITWIDTMTLDSTGNLTVAGTITSNSKTVLTDFAHSFSTNGYQKLSNGLIIQWGTMPLTGDNTNATITFPISFPNSCVSIVPSIDTVSTGAGNWSVYAKTTSNFSANYSSTVSNSSSGYYIAIGY